MPTTQYTLDSDFGKKILAVKANGGTVAVEKMIGGTWVPVFTSSGDGAWTLDLGNSPTRFTPAGGAAFEVLR